MLPVTAGATCEHAGSRALCKTLFFSVIKHSVKSYGTNATALLNALRSGLKKARRIRLPAQKRNLIHPCRGSWISLKWEAQLWFSLFLLVPVAEFGYGLHNKRELTAMIELSQIFLSHVRVVNRTPSTMPSAVLKVDFSPATWSTVVTMIVVVYEDCTRSGGRVTALCPFSCRFFSCLTGKENKSSEAKNVFCLVFVKKAAKW